MVQGTYQIYSNDFNTVYDILKMDNLKHQKLIGYYLLYSMLFYFIIKLFVHSNTLCF